MCGIRNPVKSFLREKYHPMLIKCFLTPTFYINCPRNVIVMQNDVMKTYLPTGLITS